MAQWTPSTASGFKVYRNPYGSPRLKYFTESTCASTATIKAGMVVSFDTVVSSAGFRIVRAPSSGGNGGNLLQVGVTSILGVAVEGSTSDGSTTGLGSSGVNDRKRQIGVAVADGVTEFIGFLKGNTAADSTLIGTQKAVVFDSTLQIYQIDSTNTTAALAAVTITGIPDYAVSDSNGPVLFKFLSTNISGAAL